MSLFSLSCLERRVFASNQCCWEIIMHGLINWAILNYILALHFLPSVLRNLSIWGQSKMSRGDWVERRQPRAVIVPIILSRFQKRIYNEWTNVTGWKASSIVIFKAMSLAITPLIMSSRDTKALCVARMRQFIVIMLTSVGLTWISCKKSVSSRKMILTEMVFDERQKQYIARLFLSLFKFRNVLWHLWTRFDWKISSNLRRMVRMKKVLFTVDNETAQSQVRLKR